MEDRTRLQAMQLVLPDGRALAADAAIPEILHRMRGWRLVVGLLRLPGLNFLTPRVYGWIARHRYQVSCLLGRLRG